ncbi:hypothetical protein [Actinomyces bowdenii]|uniref:Uncharacterized protein n=1 Tax=Actinomyces bowdenii TaxID=131109 RepID=A0A853EJQ9_9ACTO|nr:hypothetical protein [Actinomyces bowdenii]MBF0696098.1 hypothetical protein [Actinomyces bowdenii]NYS68271.1 hypothetical protein [Actinomyces bowdenii]
MRKLVYTLRHRRARRRVRDLVMGALGLAVGRRREVSVLEVLSREEGHLHVTARWGYVLMGLGLVMAALNLVVGWRSGQAMTGAAPAAFAAGLMGIVLVEVAPLADGETGVDVEVEGEWDR